MHETARFGPIEWATAGRALPGEDVSGDQPVAIGIGDGAALFGVMDGLGHGPDAATAAQRAVEALEAAPNERPELLVRRCHRALGGTRGVAMTLARIDFAAGTLTWCGVGNVSGNLVARDASGTHIRASASPAGGIVGYRVPEVVPVQTISIRTGDLLVISSDGIDEHYVPQIDFAAPAGVIAKQILSKNAKQTDDAVVLAARHRGTST